MSRSRSEDSESSEAPWLRISLQCGESRLEERPSPEKRWLPSTGLIGSESFSIGQSVPAEEARNFCSVISSLMIGSTEAERREKSARASKLSRSLAGKRRVRASAASAREEASAFFEARDRREAIEAFEERILG